MNEKLLPAAGGYRKLRSFQLAQLIYDITVRFVELYIDRKSRTCDQMTQAARSGVQNLAEGSVASATSKKTELKLTNVARASLEELRLDYEDFLRQRNLPLWEPEHPILNDFKAKRIHSMEAFRQWLTETRTNTDGLGHSSDNGNHQCPSVPVRVCPRQPELVANAVLSLLNLTNWLLSRQLTRLAADFEQHGGFTERLYRVRRKHGE